MSLPALLLWADLCATLVRPKRRPTLGWYATLTDDERALFALPLPSSRLH